MAQNQAMTRGATSEPVDDATAELDAYLDRVEAKLEHLGALIRELIAQTT